MAQLTRQVAASVDAPPSLIPVLGELFEGLESLGSSPRMIANLLAGASLGERSRILDLACGKGAAAIAVARRFGCRVLGIDAFEPFIAHAQRRADRRGLQGLCVFRAGDVLRAPRGPFDAALMLGLFPVDRAAPLLRSRVRRGGVYIVDDAFLDTRFAPIPRGLRSAPTLPMARACLERFGDAIIAERIPSPAAIRRMEQALYARIASQAASLAREHPRLRPSLRVFLANQKRAAAILSGPLRPAIWLVRRGPRA